MQVAEHVNLSAFEEALPDVLMRVVSELHDVAYLIERIEPQLLEATNGAVQKAAQLGANNVLAKPFSIDKMKAAIEAVFGSLK